MENRTISTIVDRLGADNHENYEFGGYGYGKNNVKILHVKRDGTFHTIREYEVGIQLQLSTKKDYLEGDNKDIIATDSQKNTVYVLAKKHGIKTPEEFGLLICEHFLRTYPHIVEVQTSVEEYPWERISTHGKMHNHAFIFVPGAIRIAQVVHRRDEDARIRSGLRNFRVMKTTQSAFKDFIQDSYRTLPDVNDRIFSTIVSSSWEYSTTNGVDFDIVWFTIKDCIVNRFAGHHEKGIFSPSVQNTLYLTERMALDKIPQISKIEMHMPNKHYFPVDLSKFSDILNNEENANTEVYLPIDKPAGIIYAELCRKELHSKL